MNLIRKLFRRGPKIRPEDNPKDPAYWHARGYKFANIMAVSYLWGQIDEDGQILPEPHISRE